MADFNFYINRQGIQGRKGDKGETGFSPAISVGTDTPNEYKLIIANESNSFETPNLRGNINVLDNGGTYLRYDAETQQISAQVKLNLLKNNYTRCHNISEVTVHITKTFHMKVRLNHYCQAS